MLCSHHHLILPASACVSQHVYLCVHGMKMCTVYEREEKSHMEQLCHTVQVSIHPTCAVLSRSLLTELAAGFLKTPAQCASVT